MRRYIKKYKFFIAAAAIALCSCNASSVFSLQKKRIPVKNQAILNNGEVEKETASKPNIAPQYGHIKDPVEQEKFYNFLFDKDKQRQIKINDEVANNNLSNLKTEYKTQTSKKNNEINKATNILPGQNKGKNFNPIVNPTSSQKVEKTKTKATENSFYIQVGAYSNIDNALKVEEKLSNNYRKVFSEKSGSGNKQLVKIKMGPFASLVEAVEVQRRLSKTGFKSSMIVHENN